NADPADEPLRILIATDAAREGLNLQARCRDMFHFDLPWNPGRIEQRNGRIDRKLQPATEVTCHYFVLPQRVEDRVLEVLVRKTETIKKELGGLPKVIEDAVEQRLIRHGIRHRDAEHLRHQIEAESPQGESTLAAAEEIEAARERREDLEDQIERCRKLLEKSRDWVRFSAEPFRQAINCSLHLLGASELAEGAGDNGHRVWTFPALEQRAATDPSWTSTLDSLRMPRRMDQKIPEWRRDAPLRPVVFEDTGRLDDQTVHLHLEQRVAQRLLARFRSQGFIYHDLSRACLAQTKDSIPRVILLGRLSLYGRGAERLHEQIIPVAARWSEPERRSGPLRAYAREAQERTMRLLDASLDSRAREPDDVVRRRLLAAARLDIADLRPHLEPLAEEFAAVAEQRLAERGRREEKALRETLQRHRKQVVTQLERYEREHEQLSFGFNAAETRQLNADIRHWRRRLAQFDDDLSDEPARVRDFYEVHVKRVEPVGLVYLWPETN
ncbi:MAG: helicase-related protein, partial [bacterium]|nr:helicase-related protein [bacterium]